MPWDALLLLATGAAAILAMVWVALAALTAGGRGGRAAALLVAALALAGAPSGLMRLRAAGVAPPEAAVTAGAVLLIGAAILCLWRLRGVPGARAGIAALAALGLVLIGLYLF